MSSLFNKIRQAYYDLLKNEVDVPGYKEAAPMKESGNHFIIRVEDSNDRSHKAGKVSSVTVITEVVTVGGNNLEPEIAGDIDAKIEAVLMPRTGALTIRAEGLQITNIRPESKFTLDEDDGTKKYYRIITRWTQRVAYT